MLELLPSQEPSGSPRPGRCWYCGRPWLRYGDAPDHLLLYGLGARLETNRACGPCNTALNKLIDQRAQVDYLVALERIQRGLRDRRRGSGRARAAAHPRQQARLPDGTAVRMDFRDPQLVPAQVVEDADGLAVVGGTREERLACAEEAVANARRKGKRLSVRQRPVGRRIHVRTHVDAKVWPRFMARAALGTCSLLGWPDDWLDGPTARKLRGWLWDQTPLADDGETPLQALLRRPPPSWAPFLCDPGEHLIMFWPGGDGRAGFHVVLFGRHWACLVIDPEGNPTPRDAWRLPVGASVRPTTWDALAEDAYLAAIDGRTIS